MKVTSMSKRTISRTTSTLCSNAMFFMNTLVRNGRVVETLLLLLLSSLPVETVVNNDVVDVKLKARESSDERFQAVDEALSNAAYNAAADGAEEEEEEADADDIKPGQAPPSASKLAADACPSQTPRQMSTMRTSPANVAVNDLTLAES